MPINCSLSSIKENPSPSAQAQKDAKLSQRTNRKTWRDIASISHGPGGFYNPRGSHPDFDVPIMTDNEPRPQSEAAAPVPEQERPVTKEAESHEDSQALEPPAKPSGFDTTQQEPPLAQNAKLDPAGFFTLVNNTNFGASSSAGQQTHHPRVQYIFADDDPAELSAALARAQEPATSTDSPRPPRSHGIIVDVAPVTNPTTGEATGGWKVTSASSISGGFAVTDAKITRMEDSASASGTKAKTGAESEEGGHNGGLMLKIDGIEVAEEDAVDTRRSLRISQSGDKTAITTSTEDYPSIIEDFDKNMTMIRKIVAASQKRANKNQEQLETRQVADQASQEKQGAGKNDGSDGDSG